MRKLIALLVTLTLIMASGSIAFAGKGTGFVNDKNYTAGVFNGFYIPLGETETDNSYLLMKWSKDWNPVEDAEGMPIPQDVGAWVTNHWTWYADELNLEGPSDWEFWWNWYAMNGEDEGRYKVTEFLKIMSVSDNSEAWVTFLNAGAWNPGWGNYDSGVPKFVVFSDSINVYDTTTGELVFSESKGINKGFGKAIF